MPRIFLLFFSAAATLSAQTATLTGRVTDSSGAVVPAAQVTLSARAAAKSTATTADGQYSFTAITPGTYTLSASSRGLAMPPAKITLRAGTQALDLVLKVADNAQQLTVQENAGPTVSLDSASNANALVLRGQDLDALSDNPDDLAADLAALAGPAAGPNGGSVYIDGFSGGQLPAKESIREIRINQNPFSPEYDKLGYGRIEIFTKPGSEKFHGALTYNYANSVWNARNPYAATEAPLLLNEFENTISGPITKRSSFTFDFERQSVTNGSVINAITAAGPFTGVLKTPQKRIRLPPRVDYQLNERNTLSLRYTYIHSDIQDAGVGGFDLASRAYRVQNGYNTVQATETAVLGTAVNETRFQYYRWAKDVTDNSNAPALQVLGAFTSGGAQTGHFQDVQNQYELQNYTSVLHGTHAWRFGVRLRSETDNNVSPQNFGGTYTFSSLAQYLSGAAPTQFSINAGNPAFRLHQEDIGLFAGDDWRIRPNLTLNLGLRYETQTNIHDHSDFAPRIGLAWAARPKTIVRAGFGIFYDRFGLGNTLNANRYNGSVEQQYVITNPAFYPAIPAIATLAANRAPQVIQQIERSLRAPYVMQTAFTLERQLPRNTTIATTYTNTRGVHILRSQVLPALNPIYLATAAGVYNQNQIITNVNSKFNPAISLFGFYVWNRARSNSDGLGTFPANPVTGAGEYGPAATDIRHRFLIGGSINIRWNIRLNPYVIVQSGGPFDVTTGRDYFGDTLFNARPGIATDPTRPGLVQTKYGLLDPNPTAGETILTRNSGRGPGQILVNLRVGKAIGFGPEKNPGANAATNGPKAGTNLAAPGGMRGMFSPATTSRRYTLSISMSARNILNHNNPGPIIGNIGSPLFGRSNQIAGAPNGEGFSENASNRRLELQLRLTF